MKIQTNQTIKVLTGEVMKDGEHDVTFGKVVGTMLANSKSGADPVKLWILAEKFYTQDEIEIDEADMTIVENAIKEAEFIPLVKGQALQMLRDAKV